MNQEASADALDAAGRAEGSFRPDVQAVFADDEHGVALVVSASSRGVTVNDAHIFCLRDGKVVKFWNASTEPHVVDELTD